MEGWRAEGLPLTRRSPTREPRPGALVDAIALTSGEGARAMPETDRAGLRDVPLHCIGEATANAARLEGFTNVTVGTAGAAPPNGASFGRILGPRFAGRTVLYPCALDRRTDFEREATAGGAHVAAWPVYRTVVDHDAVVRLDARLRSDPPQAILLHAPSAAQALRGIPVSEIGAAKLCLSDAVAAALPDDAAASVLVAERPTDEALVSLLWKVAG